MANTSSRSFRLLSLLQNHRYWSGADLSERLGVSARTLRRDVDRLRELGYPVQAHPGVDGGYQLAAGAALPPLVVDDDEAVALAVGLLLATQGGVGAGSVAGDRAAGDRAAGEVTVAEASARALAKVVQVMPARLRRRAEAVAAVTEPASWSSAPGGQAAAVNPDILASTALACRDAERIRFDYKAASGERTQRHVEPHRLVTLDRRWYLVGYDLARLDWRNFRLDRVSGAVEATGARFRPRALPAADAAEFVRRSIATSGPAVYQVEAVIEAPAAAVRDRIGRWAAIEETGQERCRITMTPSDLDWPLVALGMTGAEFRIVSPPELAGRVRDWGGRFRRAAGTAETSGTPETSR
ncbi:MAG TPA: YafY family protein [Trebonia sp.]|nr:YafY family protein [Trebonia sp.]